MSDGSGAEFGTDASIEAAANRGLEKPAFQVQWPLVRSLDASGMFTALNNRLPLNSTEMRNTYFWCHSPELPLVSKTYAGGTDDIGAFVVFPHEANNMKPEKDVGNTDKLFQVTLPPDSRIDYSTYLFVRPQDWEIINTCQSIDEARQRLEEQGIDHAEIEEEALGKFEGLIDMREEIIDFLLTHYNPLITNESLWEDFERRFRYNDRGKDEADWVNSRISRNLSDYKNMLMKEGTREEREAELRTRQVFDPFILKANYEESRAIVEFLRNIQASS